VWRGYFHLQFQQVVARLADVVKRPRSRKVQFPRRISESNIAKFVRSNAFSPGVTPMKSNIMG